MLSPVICTSCAAHVHPADNRATASTATLRTMVAIPATSMLEIRLDAMHHSWRQSSGSVDLDQAVSGRCAGSARRSGICNGKIYGLDAGSPHLAAVVYLAQSRTAEMGRGSFNGGGTFLVISDFEHNEMGSPLQIGGPNTCESSAR